MHCNGGPEVYGHLTVKTPAQWLRQEIQNHFSRPLEQLRQELAKEFTFFFLVIALWSRHVKPSSAKGEKRLKREKIPKFVQAEALPESKSCTSLRMSDPRTVMEDPRFMVSDLRIVTEVPRRIRGLWCGTRAL